MAAGPPFLGRLPLPTIPQQPPELDIDTAFSETKRRHPDFHGDELVTGFFADVTAEAVSGVLLPALEEYRPDLLIYEAMNAGAGVVASVLDIPAVAYAITLTHHGPTMVHPAAVQYRKDLWTNRGLQPPEGSPLLSRKLLDPIPPSLRVFRNHLDVTTIPIRPVPYAENSGALPSWLEVPRSRPRVYLTLGTVSFGAVEVLSRAVDEIAGLDVDLLVAVGPEGDPKALGGVPDHIHLERFVDQSRVLPLVDLVVHHGGTGTVLAALATGLPQLILPQGADQFLNAEVLLAVGAARRLRNEEQEPGAIRRAVSDLLSDGAAEKVVAQQIQAEIADLPAPAELVPELAALAGPPATGQRRQRIGP